MIKLLDILESIANSPKAIFLSGPAGSGKSFWNKKLIPTTFKTINSDDTYEELLKKSGIGLKQKDFTPDQLSQAGKLQAQARKTTNDILAKSMEDRNNLVIDGTGASSKTVLKKKQELEDLGYKTFMFMIYVSPLTSLERNKNRDRSLMPSIILRTWRDVNKNVDIYKQEFGNDFVIINTDEKDANKEFSQELVKPYFADSSAIGKPKTPEQISKSKAEKEQLNNDIKQMVKTIPEFDTTEIAKQKINQFTK